MKKQTYSLKAQLRAVLGKKVLSLREKGLVPAVVYGPGGESQALSCALGEFEKIYRSAGESSLIQLSLDNGEPVNVLIHDVQMNPVTHKATHVDFYRVNMAEKLTTHIPLVFIDES
ncbi:MAG: 50S ribosomal protein L25, partial [Patescibacteria group bacterium]